MSDDTDNAPKLRDVMMRDGELTPTGTGQLVLLNKNADESPQKL